MKLRNIEESKPLLFAAGLEMVKKVCLLKKSENSGSLKFPNSMNGLRAVKALTDSRRKSKKIIRQGADKDGCQENAIICIAMGEL